MNADEELFMKKVFVIGGIGAGKSTARKALEDQGLACIDLDRVGHEVHHWQVVKDDLVATFGEDILDENGEVIRPALARKAFANPDDTRRLNRIMQPRIEDVLMTRLDELEASGCPAVVVEYSVFRNRETSLAWLADVIVAITAPVESRVARAVAMGFEEQDVRRRIERQITDEERVEKSDVVFENDGSQKDLYNKVVSWWKNYSSANL